MNYLFRNAKMKDKSELTKLLVDYDIHMFGVPETTEDDVKNLLEAVENLETHSWIVEKNDSIIGFALITKKGKTFPSLVVVHPSVQGEEIELALLKEMEAAISEGTIIVSSNNDYEHTIFHKSGFIAVRHWFKMYINVENKQIMQVLPQKYKMDPFVLNQDEKATHEAFEESFQTHFGYEPSTLEEFHKRTEKEGFDPNIWFLLKDGKEIAGFIFCRRSSADTAEITHIGVRPNWGRKKLGKLLLQYAFSALQIEGRNCIYLDVDSKNGTGALQLYEAVGMSIQTHFIRFDKLVN